MDVGGFWMIFTGFMWCERPKIQINVVFVCKNYIYLTKSSAQAKQLSSQQGKTAAGRQFLWNLVDFEWILVDFEWILVVFEWILVDFGGFSIDFGGF